MYCPSDLRETFQSPDGDFVYSDWVWDNAIPMGGFGFNPLTGISSILTRWLAIISLEGEIMFQSPDGDFVYSDEGGDA